MWAIRVDYCLRGDISFESLSGFGNVGSVFVCEWRRAYSSPTHPTSLHSRRLRHSGRCPGYSGRTHTGTPPRCRWLPSHLRLHRHTQRHRRMKQTLMLENKLINTVQRLAVWSSLKLRLCCWVCQKLHLKLNEMTVNMFTSPAINWLLYNLSLHAAGQ